VNTQTAAGWRLRRTRAVRRWVPAIALVAGLHACAIPPNNRSKVSGALERRTGHTVAESKPGETVLPSTVSFEDGLSEDEAITLALWNNAAFQETLADLGLSRADLIQAGMLPNPTFSAFIPAGAKPLELTALYPIEVLWLRPQRVAAAELDYERTAERLVQSGLDLIREVRLAYSDLILANQLVMVAEENAALAAQIEQVTRVRLAAGEVSELEASAAAVDALQADEHLARSRQDTRLARERLWHLLGVGSEPRTMVIGAPLPLLPVVDDVELLVTRALAARPDLRAAELGLEAAGRRIGLARASAFSLAAGVNAKPVDGPFLVGPAVGLPVPILNQNQGGVASAKAGFEKAARQYFTVRDRIELEVREAHSQLVQAQESFTSWHERILPPLDETVRGAKRAYAIGDASFLLVLDSSRKLTEARATEAVAAADVRRATAELERSIGGRLRLHDEQAKTTRTARY
jgi:cobalt-zinc-cadmium efflux system outer membrane protein